MKRLLAIALLLALADDAAAADSVRVRAGQHPGFSRIVFDWTRAMSYEARIEGDALIVRFAEPFEADFDAVTKRVPDSVAAIARLDQHSVRFALRRPATLRHFLYQGSVVIDVMMETAALAPPAPAPTPARAAAPITPPPTPQATPRAPAPIADAPPAPLIRQAQTAPPPGVNPDAPAAGMPSVKVALGIAEAQRAAMFRRGARLWLVFDAPARVDLDALARDLGARVDTVEQFPLSTATVVGLVMPPTLDARLERGAGGWALSLSPEPRPAAPALKLDTRADGGGRVRINGSAPGVPIQFKDPQVGDQLWVVPMAPFARGLDQRRQFADFQLLPSMHGLALEQRGDGLTVSVEGDTVVIAAEEGLRLSTAADRRQEFIEARNRLFGPDLAADHGNYIDEKRRRQAAVIAASGEARREARYDLARFELANGFAADALGGFELQLGEFKDSEQIPLFLLMRGVARLLDGDFTEAGGDLKHPLLIADAEAALWRSALLAAEGDFANASRGFSDGASYLESYSAPIRQRLLFAAAEAALNIGDAVTASERLDTLATLAKEPTQAARFDVMRGRLKALEGDAEAALTIWDDVQERPSQRARAEAEYARLELLLAKGAISRAEAIARFDRLRFAWRGDEFELAVLARLGELRLAEGLVRDGLLTLKSAAQLFPDNARTPALTERMRSTFRSLFAADGASMLPAIGAIALYEEFRELVPAGADGDRLIEGLVERLVEVDLLDNAAALLDHQIGFRVTGGERARLGARLAEIRLMLGNAEAAQAAIGATRAEPLDPALTARRRLLSVQAMAMQGKTAEALALVAAMEGTPALRLKAQLEWQQRNWPAAAATLRTLAGQPPAAGVALEDERARDILGHVIALYLAGDTDGVRAARRDYAAAIGATRYADEFRVYSGELGPVKDVAELKKRLGEVELFKTLGNVRPASAKPAN